MRGYVGMLKIRQDAPAHPGRRAGVDGLEAFESAILIILIPVKAWHIHATKAGQATEALGAGHARLFTGVEQVRNLNDRFLPVANKKCINKQMQRFGIEGAGPARKHDGVPLAALGAQDGNTAQVPASPAHWYSSFHTGA